MYDISGKTGKTANQSKIRFIHAAFKDRLQIFGFTARLARVVVLHFVYYRYLPSELAVSENDRRFPCHCGESIALAVDLRNGAGDQNIKFGAKRGEIATRLLDNGSRGQKIWQRSLR